MRRTWHLGPVSLVLLLVTAACGGSESGSAAAAGDDGDQPTLVIGGIPDQEVAVLEERFGGLAEILSERLDVPVEYTPSTDYSALVTAFRNGDVQLGWFGGLTGVQARLATDGADAIAQRPIDTEFESVFVVNRDVAAETLTDLEGLTFTFGSESSTSGHLMPRFFLREAGVDAAADFDGPPSFSGSHDRTWKLVESGAFEAGALNAAVWDRAVEEDQVDTDAVRVIRRTDPYYDYHWVAHPRLDDLYGEGFTERLRETLLELSTDDPEAAEVLELFQADEFIATSNENYEPIEQVARDLGLIGG